MYILWDKWIGGEDGDKGKIKKMGWVLLVGTVVEKAHHRQYDHITWRRNALRGH